MLKIIDFNEGNREFIKTLNYEWLQAYFEIEPSDIRQLSNPESEILEKGGHIFYAELDGVIAGTASLLKLDEETYELGKMATTENSRGKGVGNLLMQHCIGFAREMKASKLILYSNRKLEPALHLYEKYGFREVPLNDSNYIRSDIKMEKILF